MNIKPPPHPLNKTNQNTLTYSILSSNQKIHIKP